MERISRTIEEQKESPAPVGRKVLQLLSVVAQKIWVTLSGGDERFNQQSDSYVASGMLGRERKGKPPIPIDALGDQVRNPVKSKHFANAS